jgi:hypothetical protein
VLRVTWLRKITTETRRHGDDTEASRSGGRAALCAVNREENLKRKLSFKRVVELAFEVFLSVLRRPWPAPDHGALAV